MHCSIYETLDSILVISRNVETKMKLVLSHYSNIIRFDAPFFNNIYNKLVYDKNLHTASYDG